MPRAEAIHPFDMRVPAGVPLLASWWWRALIAGITLGLVPLVCVLWGIIDTPMGAWMEARWPTLLLGASAFGSPSAWLMASAAAYLAAAALRQRDRARWAFLFLCCIGAAVVLCLLIDGCAELGHRVLPGVRSDTWSHLAPSVRCATIAAAATTGWLRWRSARRVWIAIVLLVCAAEVARGVVFASDAISGAWLGVLMALLVPWAWWRVHPDTLPGVRPAAGWASSP